MHKTQTSRSEQTPAHQRLLAAAARVFARDGLEGATTRKIALEAGVNEVTLFRHFSTKENLLAAVVGRAFGPEAPRPKPVLPEATGDLRADLANFGRFYESMLTDNLPLIRTLIGEIHRHREHERQVLDGIFRPLRTELIARLNLAREGGAVRPEVDTAIIADQLAGMIFTGVLRRSGKSKPAEYRADDYLEACVEVLARGIGSSPRRKRA